MTGESELSPGRLALREALLGRRVIDVRWEKAGGETYPVVVFDGGLAAVSYRDEERNGGGWLALYRY